MYIQSAIQHIIITGMLLILLIIISFQDVLVLLMCIIKCIRYFPICNLNDQFLNWQPVLKQEPILK